MINMHIFIKQHYFRFESDTKLSVNTVKLGDNYASSVEFSNVNLIIKRILYDYKILNPVL